MGRKYAARADANQPDITHALRSAGCLVQTTHMIGRGFPDLLICYRGVMALVEVKNGDGKLTPDEAAWHDKWRDAPVYICRGVEDVPALLQRIEHDYTA